jgi:hypothetical protein
MLESMVQGPHAGQQLASLILVLFAAVYVVYAMFGRPHDALRPILDGIPIGALLGVYTYAFDLNQRGAYSRLLTTIVGTSVTSYTLLLLAAAMGFAQPFLSDYARARVARRRRFERFERDENAKESGVAVALSILIRMAVAAFWITLGLLVALDRYDWLRGQRISLSAAILVAAAIAFLMHLPQVVRAAQERSGESHGFAGPALVGIIAGVAGVLAFAAALALFVFAASHLGWSVLVYLLLFGLITAAYSLAQRIVTHLPRPALGGLAVLLLLIAGGFALAARG